MTLLVAGEPSTGGFVQAAISRWLALFARSSPLKDFTLERARAQATEGRYLGIRVAQVDRIVGSVGRVGDFDRSFQAKDPRHHKRTERIRRLFERDLSLPPVELYKLRDEYYVLDGHHRVAAARELGREFVDAEVIEFVAPDETAEKLVA